MIINQIVAGSGGGGLDTFDATAYPEHILEGYTAYARGEEIIGEYIEDSTGIVLPSYTGLTLHLDASDTNSLVFGTGNYITEWKDISGNNNDCPVLSLEKPFYSIDAANGRPAIGFIDSSERFTLQDFDLSSFTIFVMMKAPAPAANRIFIRSAEMALGWRDNGNQFSYSTNYGSSNTQLPYNANNYDTTGLNLFCVQRTVPSQSYARLNFKQQETIGSTKYWWAVGDPYLGSLPEGYVAEIILYNTILSGIEMTMIENYFIEKYLK